MKRLTILALVAMLLTACDKGLFLYPVRVSFHFNYDGKPVETSYLTVIRAGPENPEVSLIRYTHGRDRASFKLPDGSLVILRPEWEGNNFKIGRSYSSAARWFWQDSVHQPRQIVYGDGATKHLATRSVPAPFTWLDVTAIIERLDQTYLSEALQADTVHDDDDKIEYSNTLGGPSNSHGTLFTSLVLQPLSPVGIKIEQPKSSPGWIAASNNCRFMPLQPAASTWLRRIGYADRVGLLYDGTSWSAYGGPIPGEPQVVYSTEKQVESQFQSLSSLFKDMVNTVRWNGVSCSGIKLPDGSNNLLIQFSNGRLAVLLLSETYVIFRTY